MVINEEEKNAFTQSVMGDTEGDSTVSVCECNIDYDTGDVELLENASVLYEQKKSGTLIAHYKESASETVYQEGYYDIMTCSISVYETINTYAFYMFLGDSVVSLIANSADAHPTGSMNPEIG